MPLVIVSRPLPDPCLLVQLQDSGEPEWQRLTVLPKTGTRP